MFALRTLKFGPLWDRVFLNWASFLIEFRTVPSSLIKGNVKPDDRCMFLKDVTVFSITWTVVEPSTGEGFYTNVQHLWGSGNSWCCQGVLPLTRDTIERSWVRETVPLKFQPPVSGTPAVKMLLMRTKKPFTIGIFSQGHFYGNFLEMTESHRIS